MQELDALPGAPPGSAAAAPTRSGVRWSRRQAKRLPPTCTARVTSALGPLRWGLQAEAAVAAPAAAAPAAQQRAGPTPEQITAIKSAIAAASTLEEVRRLEEALKTGHLPSEIAVGGEDEAGGAANGGAAAMEEG